MGNCCGPKDTKQMASDHQRRLMDLNRGKKDKYGKPIHRARGEPFYQDEVIYRDLAHMADMAYSD